MRIIVMLFWFTPTPTPTPAVYLFQVRLSTTILDLLCLISVSRLRRHLSHLLTPTSNSDSSLLFLDFFLLLLFTLNLLMNFSSECTVQSTFKMRLRMENITLNQTNSVNLCQSFPVLFTLTTDINSGFSFLLFNSPLKLRCLNFFVSVSWIQLLVPTPVPVIFFSIVTSNYYSYIVFFSELERRLRWLSQVTINLKSLRVPV